MTTHFTIKTILVLGWIPPGGAPETRIQGQAVFGGCDPRKHELGSGRRDREGTEAQAGCVVERRQVPPRWGPGDLQSTPQGAPTSRRLRAAAAHELPPPARATCAFRSTRKPFNEYPLVFASDAARMESRRTVSAQRHGQSTSSSGHNTTIPAFREEAPEASRWDCMWPSSHK